MKNFCVSSLWSFVFLVVVDLVDDGNYEAAVSAIR